MAKKIPKPPNILGVFQWKTNNLWYIHTVEQYIAKGKNVSIQSTTYELKNLGSINTYCITALILNSITGTVNL